MKKLVSSLLAVSTAFMLLAMPVNTNKAPLTPTRIVSAATNSGWVQSSGKWYYKENGTYVRGWKYINGKWYHFDSTGAMVTGWKSISGKWYYFNTTNGDMVTAWKKIGSSYYYFASDGALRTGWFQVGSAWYYANNDGVMQKGWQLIGGRWYYLGADGAMRKGWFQVDGSWYYTNNDGVMQTGWQKIGGYWYFLNSSGVMQRGWIQIGSEWNNFDPSGVWQGALSANTIYNSMIALKTSYPEGMRWTNDNFYAWKGGVYSGGFGCAGFAFLLSDAAFGDLPARKIVDRTNIRVGDIIRINNDSHSVIVLAVDGDTITVAEGNYNSSIHWGRTLNRNTMNYSYTLTRYPA